MLSAILPVGTYRRRVVKTLSRPSQLVLGLAIIPWFILWRFFEDIEIAWVSTERIGHFVADVGLFVARESLVGPKPKVLYCRDPRELVSNSFWLEIFERNLGVVRWTWPIVWASQLFPKNPSWISLPPRFVNGSHDTEGVFDKFPPIQFRLDEEEKGKNWLKSQGWSEGEPFVCLLARDASYLRSWQDHGRVSSASVESFHGYRNSDIMTYLEAAEWLAENGVWVIRMGSLVEKAFISTNPRVIDYASGTTRSDFLDVWLFARCNFCITTGTGPDYVAQLFRRPTLLLNHLPLAAAWISSFTVTAGKNLFRTDGSRLTLEEHVDAFFVSSEDYAKRGILISNLSSETITQIVKEMWKIVNENQQQNDGFLDWNKRFLALLRQPKFRHLHNFVHPKAQASSVWLRQLFKQIGETS